METHLQVIRYVCSFSTGGDLLSSELQQGVEQNLLEAGLYETDGQMSPITAQLYATASLWANHNGSEEANGNGASLQLANQERGMADSNSSGGKCSFRQKNISASSVLEILCSLISIEVTGMLPIKSLLS